MTFTPLEALAIAAFFSLVSAVAVRLMFSRSFMTRTQCSSEREKLCVEKRQLSKDLQELKEGQRLQFRMLRGIVVHSGIPADKQRGYSQW